MSGHTPGRLYADRDIIQQGKHYTDHVRAMTAEGLHSKSDIAAELAHRDIQRDELLAALDKANAARIAAQTENESLKAERAASGVAERRAVRDAVLAEREGCAVLVHDWNTAMTDKLAAATRARSAP